MNLQSRRLSGISSLLCFLFLSLAQPAHTEDETVNRLLASQCAQCHGTNGYSQNDIEGIAGEEAKDMFEDLSDMKGEDQPENIMDHQALGYSDDQIRRIAQFYATLPEKEPGTGEVSGEGGDENEYEDKQEDEEDEEDEEEEED